MSRFARCVFCCCCSCCLLFFGLDMEHSSRSSRLCENHAGRQMAIKKLMAHLKLMAHVVLLLQAKKKERSRSYYLFVSALHSRGAQKQFAKAKLKRDVYFQIASRCSLHICQSSEPYQPVDVLELPRLDIVNAWLSSSS